MIYFIANRDRSRIKIGTTIRLSQRLKQLVAEHGEGLEVLAVRDGDRDVERELHRRFAHLNVVNEWFEPGDDLMGLIVSDGKPWDGSDEAPALPSPTLIRVSDEFADAIRKASALTDVSHSDFADTHLLAIVQRIYRDTLAKESKRMGGQGKGATE